MLSKGNFHLKGVTFSGMVPTKNLSNYENYINVAGLKWTSKADLLSLNISELKLDKRNVRKDCKSYACGFPDKCTKSNCASRVGEVFVILGWATPMTAGLKLDLSELSRRGLESGDNIPDELVPTWKENFETISKLGELKFQRVIVPDDAVNLEMGTIEIADASLNIACSAVYARFKSKNGLHSCQLVFARSKILSPGITIPRAELFAAGLNATTGHIVKTSLTNFIRDRINLRVK